MRAHVLLAPAAELPVVMITAHGTVDNAVEALKTGAFDYLTKPFDQIEVRTIVAKALRTRDPEQALANLLTDILYAVLDPRIRYGQRPT